MYDIIRSPKLKNWSKTDFFGYFRADIFLLWMVLCEIVASTSVWPGVSTICAISMKSDVYMASKGEKSEKGPKMVKIKLKWHFLKKGG